MANSLTATHAEPPIGAAPKAAAHEGGERSAGQLWWRWGIPVGVTVVLAVLPAPAGLAQNAWNFFALFAGIVAALVLEPIPPAATGVLAITLAALLSRWTLFSPQELANPKFKVASETVKWAFSGFASNTVWLVGGAFMFALAYEKTGAGKAHRAAAGTAARQELAVARLRHDARRHDPGAVHAFEHRAQRRHDVPGRSSTCRRSTTRCRTIRRRAGSAATSCGPRSPRAA